MKYADCFSVVTVVVRTRLCNSAVVDSLVQVGPRGESAVESSSVRTERGLYPLVQLTS